MVAVRFNRRWFLLLCFCCAASLLPHLACRGGEGTGQLDAVAGGSGGGLQGDVKASSGRILTAATTLSFFLVDGRPLPPLPLALVLTSRRGWLFSTSRLMCQRRPFTSGADVQLAPGAHPQVVSSPVVACLAVPCLSIAVASEPDLMAFFLLALGSLELNVWIWL